MEQQRVSNLVIQRKTQRFFNKKEDKKDGKVVSHEEWVQARKALLAEEKNVTRYLDTVTKLRQQLPWEKVTEDYVFDSVSGPLKLSTLFNAEKGIRDLIVYHWMFAAKDENGCPVCASFLDGFNGYLPHLAHHRKVAFAAVARAPIEKLTATVAKQGWNFQVLSSGKNNFNIDYAVAVPDGFADDHKHPTYSGYNYGEKWPTYKGGEWPGMSVFRLGSDGTVYHTYSTYCRGLDLYMAGNQLLDMLPHGRDGFVALEHLKK